MRKKVSTFFGGFIKIESGENKHYLYGPALLFGPYAIIYK